MATQSEVLGKMAENGIVFNPVSDIFDEGDIASESLYEEAGIEDFGPEMAAYLSSDELEIVSVRNSETIKFSKLDAGDAVEEIISVMDRFYRDLLPR